ncbi:MAG TPA: hypothetical protein VJ933_06310 [Phaeodactylibacter sp.]|nr:hypothetical protein [Phaeodactylibacter sp.]
MDNISFQYPSWYIILCLLLGLIVALLLYYRSQTFREQSRALNWLLGSLRFLGVSLIALLLLSPLLRSLVQEVKKPIIVLAQDASESVGQAISKQDSVAYRSALQQLQQELSEQYEVQPYTFGSEVREGIDFNFTDKQSNISEMLSSAYDLYSGQNLGAVVLATDGIYNEGSNPVYSGGKLGAPVYTIALGDTVPKKDLVVKRIFHNRIAYLGDKFSLEIDILAENAAGSNSQLRISKVENGQTRLLQQQPVPIDDNSFFDTREIILDANQVGVQRYRISITGVEGEASLANNSKDIFIDVLDARQKILILANAPHPDVTALRQAISNNKNYEVSTAYADAFTETPQQYDFIILHNLPSRTNDASRVFNSIQSDNIPHLFIVGLQTNLNRFNEVQQLIRIQTRGGSENQVQAAVAADFALFTLSEELKSSLPNFAPLTAYFGEFQASPEAETLLYQRIGEVTTQYPLFVVGDQRGTKTGVLAAEGLWRWRLFDYLQNQDHERFNQLVGKVVQYLSLKEDKRRFRVSLSKNIFDENENIYFDAELYNKSFELVNEPDASLTIKDAEGKEYNYTFNKTGNAYRLNAGILPVGNYSFQAAVFYNGERLTYDGQFSVKPIQLERYATTADHNLMRLLSERYGGELVYPDNIGSIADKLQARETVKPVIYETAKTRPVIDLKWLFFVLLLLFTLEWGLRRYYGAY